MPPAMWLFANAGDARLGRANNRKLYRDGPGLRVTIYPKQLFVSVFLGVSFACLLSMMSRMTGMPTCAVCVMCRFFVVAASVMFGRLRVVTRCMGMML